MPILPPLTPLAPYDVLETILNTARVRMNDAIASLGGDVLQDTRPFTQQMANTAWRRLQNYLANLGDGRLVHMTQIWGLPPVGTLNPGTPVWIDWTGYSDGSGIRGWDHDGGQFTTYYLPQDLTAPLKMWERIAGQNAPFIPMTPIMDGLPSVQKGPYNRYWAWENDRIYMPGSLNSMDIQIRYIKYFLDFVTIDDDPWYAQPVPIVNCLDALAFYICVEAAKPRGDVDGEAFEQSAQKAANLIFNRDVRMKQRANVRRRPRSMGRGYGGGYGDSY